VGRITTSVVVVLGMVWIPLMKQISGVLYQYLQSVQSYLAPPIAAVFLLGVFSKRINANGAYAALVIGFLVGVLRIVLELNRASLSGFWLDFATINFLYFCITLFLFSIAVMVIVSLLSAPPPASQLNGLTFATTVKEDRMASRASWNSWDVWLSVGVLLVVICVFCYFSPLGVGK
jgi:SSS family solute:Na+ symporter